MVYQSSFDGCGKASVRNFLVLEFKDRAYEACPIEETCKDFLSMEKALSKNGRKRESYERKDIRELKKTELPCIVQVLNGDKNHFAVVKKLASRGIFLMDPDYGERSLSYEEWERIYLGRVRIPAAKNKVTKPKPIQLVSKTGRILYLFLYFVRTAALCLSLVFRKAKEGFLISVLFWTLFGISLSLTNRLPFILRKKYQKRIRFPYLEKTREKDDREKLSLAFQEEIKTYSRIVNTACLVSSLSFLLLFDNLYSAFLVLIGILFSLVRNIYAKRKNYYNWKCTDKEREFVQSRREQKRNCVAYECADERAMDYLGSLVFLSVAEIRCLALRLRILRYKDEAFSLSYFLFRLRTALTISYSFDSLLKTKGNHEKEIRLLNSLSCPLNDFVSEKSEEKGYNKTNPGGDFDGKKADQGLSEQNRN